MLTEKILFNQEETALDINDLRGIDPDIANTVSHLQVS